MLFHVLVYERVRTSDWEVKYNCFVSVFLLLRARIAWKNWFKNVSGAMSDAEQRYRLVVLGSGRVGKSSIIRRLLKDEFVEAYKATVEDLHCREYEIDGNTIKVILMFVIVRLFEYVVNELTIADRLL